MVEATTDHMNINLTKQEFVMLLRMVNIGDWVMFSRVEGDEDDAPFVKEHQKVLQTLFAAAYKAKIGDLVIYEPTVKKYFETGEFERDYHEFIDQYEETSFWEELANRLASRDLAEQLGDDTCETMDPTERFIQVEELAGHYNDEFDEHGLLRLHLLNAMKKGNV